MNEYDGNRLENDRNASEGTDARWWDVVEQTSSGVKATNGPVSPEPTETPHLDPSSLAKIVEQEVASVLTKAEKAATEIRAKAQRDAAAMVLRAADAARKALARVEHGHRELERLAQQMRASIELVEEASPAQAARPTVLEPHVREPAAITTVADEPGPAEPTAETDQEPLITLGVSSAPRQEGANRAAARAGERITATEEVVRQLREHLT